MTRRPLTPEAARFAALGGRMVARFGGLLFPYRVDFTLNAQAWAGVPCNVQDPAKAPGALAAELRRREDAADLRLLRVDPAAVLPPVGASCVWDGGVLRVEAWSQDGTYTGARVGVCRYVPGVPGQVGG